MVKQAVEAVPKEDPPPTIGGVIDGSIISYSGQSREHAAAVPLQHPQTLSCTKYSLENQARNCRKFGKQNPKVQ